MKPPMASTSPPRALPDLSRSASPGMAQALDWVGMRNIRLPLQLDDPLCPSAVPSGVDMLINLPCAGIRGIHMSRLYTLLMRVAKAPLSPAGLIALLQQAIAGHAESRSDAGRFVWHGEIVRPTGALVTPDLEGWMSHAVKLEAELSTASAAIWLTLEATYASTCPCSASLARQLIQEQFEREHAGQGAIDLQRASDWIGRNASFATPHSQRSLAQLRVRVDPSARWDLGGLIGAAHDALGTFSQGPVKRADEQAFAQRNGHNLMFVEDAARRLLSALSARYAEGVIEVTHLESLHPHDAHAAVRWGAA